MTVAAEFGSGQVFWSLLWLTMFVLWIWLVIVIFADIMRSQDLSGWGKAMWAFGIIFLPLIGIVLYLVVNGDGMDHRAEQTAAAEQLSPHSATTSERLARLASLHETGTISDAEYAESKSQILQ